MVMCQREYGESTLLDWVVLEGFSEEVTFELRVNEQKERVLGKWGRSIHFCKISCEFVYL